MTEVTFETLTQETHTAVWHTLRYNIPKSTVKHITDGFPTELKRNEEYPFVLVGNPDSDDIIENHNIDYTTLNDIPIEVPINIHTLSAKEMRELTDLVKYTIMKNLKSSQVSGAQSLNEYGLTLPVFSSNISEPKEIDDESGRYEYHNNLVITFTWGGSTI